MRLTLVRLFVAGAGLLSLGGGAQARGAGTRPVPRLTFSTYWGAGGAANRTVCIDPAGNVYMCGGTGSGNWPTTPGAVQSELKDGRTDGRRRFADGWVAKISHDGKLVFATLYGGTAPGPEAFFGPSVDPWGYVYCTGRFSSTDCPVTPDAFQRQRGGTKSLHDAVLAVFSPDGRQLVYGSYFGGSGVDMARHLAVRPDGSAVYIIGETASQDLPLVEPLQRTPAGAFLARFDLSRR